VFAAVAIAARAAAGRSWDAGRRAAAQRYLCAALHAAHQADRIDLALNTISDLAYTAIRNNEPDRALHLLHRAAATETRDSVPGVRREHEAHPIPRTLAAVLTEDAPLTSAGDGVWCPGAVATPGGWPWSGGR
jgi:hypothetical protein